MLTTRDLAQIKKLIGEQDLTRFKKLIRLEVDEALDEKLDEKLKEKFKYLPTKDEFYKTMDKIMKELEAIREELTLTPSHADLAKLEERIEPLERLHPGDKHVAVASV